MCIQHLRISSEYKRTTFTLNLKLDLYNQYTIRCLLGHLSLFEAGMCFAPNLFFFMLPKNKKETFNHKL